MPTKPKKVAKPKKAPPAMPGGDAPRGAALVELAYARLRADDAIVTPRPVPPGVLDQLAFSNGSPLPPSLRALLALDASWVVRTLGWFDDPTAPELIAAPVSRLVHDRLEKAFASWYRRLPAPLPHADALPLETGSESMRVLFLGSPDAGGEYPVLGVDLDTPPIVTFEAPGFDVWLAVQAGIVNRDAGKWPAVWEATRARVFGDMQRLECEIGDDDGAPEPPPPQRQAKPKAKVARATGPVIPDDWSEERIGKGLAEAIEIGDAARVDAFLSAAKARFPKAKTWGPLAVHQLTYSSDAALAKRLFAAGASPDALGPYGAVFATAAGEASRQVLEAFIDAGATLDAPSGNGKGSALTAACAGKRPEIVELLLSRGANPKLVDKNGMGPLHHAADLGTVDPDDVFVRTVEMARKLLDAGAEIDWRDGNRTTVLHRAVASGNEPLVRFLLERKADPNIVQWNGDNALTLAVRNKHADLVPLLRAAGARSDVKNADGWSVDDVTPRSSRAPAKFEVKLQCRAEPQKATLSMELALLGPMLSLDVGVARWPALAVAGATGSDVFAPDATRVEMKGGGLDRLQKSGHRKGRWELTLASVAPAGVALLLRPLLQQGFTILSLSLVGEAPLAGGPLAIDTARATTWLDDPASEPLAAWRDLGFPVSAVGRSPFHLAFVVTRRPLEAEMTKAFGQELWMAFAALPKLEVKAGSFFLVDASHVTPRGFDVTFNAFGPFPYDPGLARAIFLNAVAKLHARTGAIAAVEWALGVPGDPTEATSAAKTKRPKAR